MKPIWYNQLVIPWEVRYYSDPVTTEAKAKIAAKFAAIIRWPLDEFMRNIEEYITGYVDGEGCFTVTFNRRPAMNTGWELRPSFSVSQADIFVEIIPIRQ